MFALATASGAIIADGLDSLRHDALDDSTTSQGGILALFDPDASFLLVLARNSFESHELCCEDL